MLAAGMHRGGEMGGGVVGIFDVSPGKWLDELRAIVGAGGGAYYEGGPLVAEGGASIVIL